MEQTIKVTQDDMFDSQRSETVERAVKTTTLSQELSELARGEMVRVAPEMSAWVPRESCTPPKYVVCRWTKQEGGTYHPVPIGGRFVRLTPGVAAALGFAHLGRRLRYETIMRMWRAELIDMVHITPGCYLLDIDSWYRHLADCLANPDMWEVGGEAREDYRFKNGLC